jgi:hypothetical protein
MKTLPKTWTKGNIPHPGLLEAHYGRYNEGTIVPVWAVNVEGVWYWRIRNPTTEEYEDYCPCDDPDTIDDFAAGAIMRTLKWPRITIQPVRMS